LLNNCIYRCLDAKSSCKNKRGKLLTNQTTVIVDITIRKDYIDPGGRTQDSQLGELLEIVLINNSMLDSNKLASAKLELFRTAKFLALEQNKTDSESPVNLSLRRSETMTPSIVKIRKVSKFLEKFINAVRSLTHQNSLSSLAKRVVEKIVTRLQPSLKDRTKIL
jgi:hypothetical protein